MALTRGLCVGLVAVASAHWDGTEHWHGPDGQHMHEHHHGEHGEHMHEHWHGHHGEHVRGGDMAEHMEHMHEHMMHHEGEHKFGHWLHHMGERMHEHMHGKMGELMHGHHGPRGGKVCPYLAKAVPEGEGYLKVIKGMIEKKNSGDCAGFASMFMEHGNFTKICSKKGMAHELHEPAELETMCKKHEHHGQKETEIKSVFPAFGTGDAMFEVEHVKNYDGQEYRMRALWQGHYCKKQQKVTRAKIIKGEAEDVPAELKSAGESFLRKVEETGDCDTTALIEEGVTMEMFGSPKKMIWGGGADAITGLEEAEAMCKKKAWMEKKVHKSVKMQVSSTYYDAAQRELTLIAQKDVVTVFKPDVVSKPVAVVLRFSKAGKIEHARFYETEVVHLESKYGQKYGKAQLEDKPEAKPELKPELKPEEAMSLERLELMPADIKKKKCEWFMKAAKSGKEQWMEKQPWFKEMEAMCSQLDGETHSKKCSWAAEKQRADQAALPEEEQVQLRFLKAICPPEAPAEALAMYSEGPTSAARGLALAFSQVAVLALGMVLGQI